MTQTAGAYIGAARSRVHMDDMGRMAICSLDDLGELLFRADTFCERTKRPFVTVSYAQSVDGSIASLSRQPIRLSGHESMTMTHQIRTLCDAILVGIETVLADDPKLTVRLVPGRSPQPIVLDTRLRMPLAAALVRRSDVSSWVVSSDGTNGKRARDLTRAGVRILSCPKDADGRIDLEALLTMLPELGIKSVMVEGGARVITSFVRTRLVDQFIITISPKLVGGLPVLERPLPNPLSYVQLRQVTYQPLGDDLVVWASPQWSDG